METPANPTWVVTDIKACCKLAHQQGVLVAVDSTVSTPVLTRPLDFGADFVCHAATKYLNGHSDVLGGILVTADAEHTLWERVRLHRKFAGPVMGTMDAWLLCRGLRTLFLRVSKQADNAIIIAYYLETHPAIEKVYYPRLKNDPGHEIAVRQMSGGFGA